MNSDELLRENQALQERLSRLGQASLRINENLDFDGVLQECPAYWSSPRRSDLCLSASSPASSCRQPASQQWRSAAVCSGVLTPIIGFSFLNRFGTRPVLDVLWPCSSC